MYECEPLITGLAVNAKHVEQAVDEMPFMLNPAAGLYTRPLFGST